MGGTIENEQAIVLRAIAYGESDRIVTLLCERHGKVSALAKGARRSTKRFAGGLGLVSLGRASFVERPGADLARLDRFEASAMWPGLLADLAKIAHAGYAAELVEALVPPRQAEAEVFELLVGFVRALDAGEANAARLRVLELKLLVHIGLQPALDRCVSCGRPADDAPGQRLDPARGGVVCGRCHADGPLLDGDGRRTLLLAQEASLADAETLALPETGARPARAAIQAILQAHLGGRALRSLEFIDKLNHAP
jgi:DNA repair protein RecO (recombination protein O)